MIRTKPMEHQIEGANFAAPKKFAGIFYEYGTGKTLIALMIANHLRLPRILVVSTKLSARYVWPSEIRAHTNFKWVTLVGSRRKKSRLLYHGMKASAPESGKYHSTKTIPTFFLINYDGIRNIYREIVKCPWDCIILDESTKIKSPHTKRTLVLWDLGKKIPRRYIMTGFPVTENLSDLYAQIKFLSDDNMLGASYHAFLNTYFVKMGTKTLPKKRMVSQLMEKISTFCIHKTNSMLKLPPKIYKKIDVPITQKQKQLLDDFKATFKLELGKVNLDTQYIFAMITKSLEICDGFVRDEKGNVEVVPTNKDEALVELLDEVDAYDHRRKCVIWCAHRFAVRKITRYLTRLKYGVVTLTGSTEDEGMVVRRFQNDKKYTIMIATQRKAAESVTLTAGRFGMYYSNTWSFDLRANSEARIRRKGSERHQSIVYTDFITEGTLEEKVYECLRKKGNLVSMLKEQFKAMKGGKFTRPRDEGDEEE